MKQIIQPQGLVDPRPRYSQAILTDGSKLLFIAGQTATDGKGNIVGMGDIEAQANQVLENLKIILTEAGASIGNIVKMTTFITDSKYREGLNKVRKGYFPMDPPTNTLLVVKGLAREEFLLEIEAIAVLD